MYSSSHHHFQPPFYATAPVLHHQPREIQPDDVTLEMIQEPEEALVTQEGKEKVRKPVDPPPIIQLKIHQRSDPTGQYMQSPYLFMCCELVPDTNNEEVEDTKDVKDVTDIEETKDNKDEKLKKLLTGTVASSLHRLKDPNNQGPPTDGGFFVFGDLSVMKTGTHRLKFSLFEFRKHIKQAVFLKDILSHKFKVVSQKDYKGLAESTYLSRAFSDQGVRLRLRKEPRAVMSGKRGYPYPQGPNAPYPPLASAPVIPHHPDFRAAHDYALQEESPPKRMKTESGVGADYLSLPHSGLMQSPRQRQPQPRLPTVPWNFSGPLRGLDFSGTGSQNTIWNPSYGQYSTNYSQPSTSYTPSTTI